MENDLSDENPPPDPQAYLGHAPLHLSFYLKLSFSVSPALRVGFLILWHGRTKGLGREVPNGFDCAQT